MNKKPITLAGIHMSRDWGHARDYVRAMWLMLQTDKPEDYVLATGTARTVKDLVNAAFEHVGILLRSVTSGKLCILETHHVSETSWEGENEDLKAIDKESGNIVLEIDPALYRPVEVNHLLGNCSRIQKELGWESLIPFEVSIDDSIVSKLLQRKLVG